MSMTTRKTRIRAGAAASAAMLALALVPTVAHAAPADEGCPAGQTGTPGDCDAPGDIDAGGDGSDEGDGNEETGNDTADVGDESGASFCETTPGFEEGVNESAEDMALPEGEPFDQTMPMPEQEQEPVIDTPRRRNPDTGVDNSAPVMTQAEWQSTMIRMLSQMPAWETESTTTSVNQTGPADLEGLGVGG